jgi:hypothetical protein
MSGSGNIASAFGVALSALALAPGAAHAQTLSLRVEGGYVTLHADGVSVRTILRRWADVSGATITNLDSLSDARVSVHFDGIPEREVLSTLLRSATGYILVPRPASPQASGSVGLILIVPARPATGDRAASGSEAATSPEIARETLPVADVDDLRDAESAAAADPSAVEEPAAEGGQPASAPGAFPVGAVVERARPPIPINVQTGNADPDSIAEYLKRYRLPQESPEEPSAGTEKPPTAEATVSSPFGVTGGSARPGVIAPVAPVSPQPQGTPSQGTTAQPTTP